MVILCAFAGTVPAQAAPLLQDKVVAIAADQTLMLAHGDKARFADILFPDAAIAEKWLTTHLLQHDLAYSAGDTDRYGRTLITSEAQEAMVRDGVAIMFNQQEIDARWIAAEQAARRAKRGVWASKDFILAPENTAQHFGEFHVVEGVVTHLYRARNATYLNFGVDWHRDFSVTIAGRNRRSFEEQLSRIHEGSKVRVRGAITEENGPMITLTRPEQLEII